MTAQWTIDLEGYLETERGVTEQCWLAIGTESFEVVDEPIRTLDAPVSFGAEYRLEPSSELEDLVCCDGAYPAVDVHVHHCPPGQRRIVYAAGACEARVEVGRVSVGGTIDRDALDEHERGNFVGRNVIAATGDVAPHVLEEPSCVLLEVLDLARVVVQSFESCEAEAYASMLGRFEIDPRGDRLVCTNEPYVCEVDFNRWDPERCRPWPPVEVDTASCSCGASSGGHGHMPWLLVLAVGFRRSHVRRRRAGASSS